jgi:hypothetical protein
MWGIDGNTGEIVDVRTLHIWDPFVVKAQVSPLSLILILNLLFSYLFSHSCTLSIYCFLELMLCFLSTDDQNSDRSGVHVAQSG